MSMFSFALESLPAEGTAHFGPKSFQEYLAKVGIVAQRTAQFISVDSLEALNPDLRKAECMVLRLGRGTGPGTSFALVRIADGWPDCFFFRDSELFSAKPVGCFVPSGRIRDLFAYSLLGSISEDSATLLGFASGLLREVLHLDHPADPILPARGGGTYTFRFRAHDQHGLVFFHDRGQVEIDQLFLARRDGKECVFIMEAKMNASTSLSKHKLLYPFLGLLPRVPSGLAVVPVYLRISRDGDDLIYNVVECKLGRENDIYSLNSLQPARVSRTRLILPAIK